MKYYLPLIALLPLISAPLISEPVFAEETQLIASEIDPELKAYARSISVKISSSNNDLASGVLIGKQDDQYLVITNKHVLQDQESFTIQTDDGMQHQATVVDNPITSDDDIALLTFSSKNNYQPVQLNSADTSKEEKQIYAIGYVAETGKFTVKPGTIERITPQPFQEGYRIGYSNDVVSGMSGGAIFDELGDLVGINGISAFPILNTAYQYQDGSTPAPEEIEQFRSLSWGLSVHRLLRQLNPEIITAYGLPQPETVADVGKTELMGWLADLETKAKQISVRIDSSSGANGSGVIIAKEDNTYTVLTADHVLCEQDQGKNCLDYNYEIVTPDGQKYPLDTSTVIRQPGVDLAVVKFSSKETYQVAELANYPITRDDAIFVAGYPNLSQNTPAQWMFSLGYGFEPEQGLFQVSDSSFKSDSSDLLGVQSGSLAGGYEMVYSNITYGGMSGSAVLDKDGRVIGIHGLAEGQTALDSQSGSATQIQLGYSLGIPLNTFVGLADRLEMAQLPVQENRPKPLNTRETKSFQAATLDAEISQDNAKPEEWLERGNQLWRLRRFSEAIEAFEVVIAMEPEFVHLAHYGKGLASWYYRTTEATLASFELATEIQPSFAPAFYYKSSLLKSLYRLDSALVAIETAISLQPDNANFYSSKGNILFELKRYEEAVEVAYNEAIDLDPRSSFYNGRGYIYYHQGKLELALSDYNQALAINPKNSNAYIHRGLFYQDQGRLELALSDYNQAISINPKNSNAYNNRGTFYHKQGKLELALSDYNQAISINRNNAHAYGNRGNLYDDEGKLDLALSNHNRAISIAPNYAEAYYNRAMFYQKQGKLELALSDYDQAISINPDYVEAYYNRASVYKKQKKLNLALSDYNQAISINPKNADAYNNRGIIYKDQGKLELALSDYDQALAINPKRVIAYNNRGIIYKDQGKLELALSDYNQAITINPKYAPAYFNRGFVYQIQEKQELALSDYNQAITINPKYTDAYYNRGIVHLAQGQQELALSDYNQVIQINPNRAYAYFILGLIHMDLKNIEQARFNSEKALQLFIAQRNTQGKKQTEDLLQELSKLEQSESDQASKPNPNSADEYYDRGFEYHQQQEYDLALADYQKAIELDFSSEKVFVNRGLIYYSQGKDDLALADYNQALSINPNNSAAYRNRGVLYFKQEKYELAKSDWDKAIEVNPKDALAYYNRGLLYKKLEDYSSAKSNLESAMMFAMMQKNNDLVKKARDVFEQLP